MERREKQLIRIGNLHVIVSFTTSDISLVQGKLGFGVEQNCVQKLLQTNHEKLHRMEIFLDSSSVTEQLL